MDGDRLERVATWCVLHPTCVEVYRFSRCCEMSNILVLTPSMEYSLHPEGFNLSPTELRAEFIDSGQMQSIVSAWSDTKTFFFSSELYCLQGNGNRTPDSFHVTRPYNLPKPIPQGLVTPCGPLPAPLQVGLPPAVLAMPLGAIDGDELRLYLADLAPTKVGRNWDIYIYLYLYTSITI